MRAGKCSADSTPVWSNSPNEWVLRGRRVMGSHFLPVFILSFVHSYNSSSKTAFQLAQIHGNLGRNVKVEVSAA